MTNFNQISLKILNLIEIYNLPYNVTRKDTTIFVGVNKSLAQSHLPLTIISSPIFILNINNIINLPENLFQPF